MKTQNFENLNTENYNKGICKHFVAIKTIIKKISTDSFEQRFQNTNIYPYIKYSLVRNK